MAGAFRAYSLKEVIGSPGIISFRKGYRRDVDVVKAESPVAFLTIEMYMGVLIMIGIVAPAKLVPGSFCILDRMDKVILLEKSKAAEYSGLVDAADLPFKFHQAQWPVLVAEGPGHQKPVGGHLDSMSLKEFFYLRTGHDMIRCYFLSIA